MPWNDLANNQTISISNLIDGINIGLLSRKAVSIPGDTKQITKADANDYLNLDNSNPFTPFALKTFNQLVVKSDIIPGPSVTDFSSDNNNFTGIANNTVNNFVSNPGPVQLISRWYLGGTATFGGVIRSTDFGVTYSSVVNISDRLHGIKFLPFMRHASYLNVEPFVAVGQNGRIITNSVGNASSWITISSPTTQDLYDVTSSNTVGVIVGDRRILKTNTDGRINSWSIVNSVNAIWRAVATNGSTFVAVGDSSAIITASFSATTWTVRSLPAPITLKDLKGVTFHSDNFWYAVGHDRSDPNVHWIMRSTDITGTNWEEYVPTGNTFVGGLYSIISIGNRLIVGGYNHQYQIINNVVTRYSAYVVDYFRGYKWIAAVKDANSNGFDMAGQLQISGIPYSAYSNF
jgi:photosystem II stability/assembly factor-like uncharacterized protein